MFTGIIKAVGSVEQASPKKGSIHLRINAPAGWKMKPGDSVSIDGICSTVKRASRGSFEVEYMPETIKKTTAGFFRKGALVNLERPLRMGDSLDGHFVQGHVDTTGKIIDVRKLGSSVILKIQFPTRYRKLIAEKGSIAVNGISLTVVDVKKEWFTPTPQRRKRLVWRFTVSLVSYTLEHTNLRLLKKGDKVNLEMDMLARYLAALLK